MHMYLPLQIIQRYPEITKPRNYRFLIYLPDAMEYEVLSALELLSQQTTLFKNTVWSLKGDMATKEMQFSSLGHTGIAKALYKVQFHKVCKKMEDTSQFNIRRYKELHLYGTS